MYQQPQQQPMQGGMYQQPMQQQGGMMMQPMQGGSMMAPGMYGQPNPGNQQQFPGQPMMQQQQPMMMQQQQQPMMMQQQQPMMMQQQQQPMMMQQQQPMMMQQPMVFPDIQGYGSFGVCAIQQQPPPEVIQFNISSDVKPQTADKAKELLVKFCEDNCCYGTKPAKECTIESCAGMASMLCEVETFVEYRSTERKTVPHAKGSPYSSPQMGVAPQPWQMSCATITHFHDKVEQIEVPFTSTVCQCNNCGGDGLVKCNPCGGDGKKKCDRCGGDGKVAHRDEQGNTHQQQCQGCNGSGQCKCSNCGGDGKVQCGTCQGKGNLRNYVQMTRTNKTLKNIKAVDNIPDSHLSPHEIQGAKGKPILEKSAVNIAPPKGFSPDVDAALAEIDKVASTQRDQLSALQHQERIRLTMVPVTCAVATHEGKKFTFYVYGEKLFVKPIDYPATCCCGCEVM